MNNPEYVRIGEHKYKINTDYRVGLKCQEVSLSEISDMEKIYALVYLLFGDVPNEEVGKLFELALKYLNCGNESRNSTEESSMDLLQDLGYIKASFMSDYKIDLDKEKMHWWTFMNLLGGLTDKCILNRVRQIREEPLKNYKGRDREKLIKAKEEVALKRNKTSQEKELDDWWEKELR